MSTPAAGNLRCATPGDVMALARLLSAAGEPSTQTPDLLGTGHVLVLELEPGLLGAAAHVRLVIAADGSVHAELHLFVVHPALAGTDAEDRMAMALLALCEESGSVDLDVSRSPSGRRRAS